MSARTLPLRRPAAGFAVLAATAVVLLTPSAALADPPALNRNSCEASLMRAATWPGSMETSSGTVRLVSDAYVSYLSLRPPCTSEQ